MNDPNETPIPEPEHSKGTEHPPEMTDEDETLLDKIWDELQQGESNGKG